MIGGEEFDVVCLSHLRWGFVYQRPQHLLSRWARRHRVFFFEEPVPADEIGLDFEETPEGVTVIVPRVPDGLSLADADAVQQTLLDEAFVQREIDRYVLWGLYANGGVLCEAPAALGNRLRLHG
jgi:UDP-galactopyranose mutase